jgi:hypothetical protein
MVLACGRPGGVGARVGGWLHTQNRACLHTKCPRRVDPTTAIGNVTYQAVPDGPFCQAQTGER